MACKPRKGGKGGKKKAPEWAEEDVIAAVERRLDDQAAHYRLTFVPSPRRGWFGVMRTAIVHPGPVLVV